MNLFHRARPQDGFGLIVDPKAAGLEYLRFGLLRLASGNWAGSTSRDEEAVAVILSGACTVRADGQGNSIEEAIRREGVFSGKPTAAYLPSNCRFEIAASQPTQVAVCWSAHAEGAGQIALVRPDDVSTRMVGDHVWKRKIYDILGSNVPAKRLLVGETFNEPGNWSSYPPHKHDVDAMPDEVKQEEVYHFRVNPPQGFGFQRIYTADGSLDQAFAIRDGDTVVIPRGYHPVAAAPGYSVYYLWMIAGSERVMRPRDDPAHAWVKQLEGKETK